MGDKVECLVDCDRELFCIAYFKDICHTLFQEPVPYLMYHRLPGVSLDICLRALNDDNNVLEMLNIYEELNVICMYMVQEGEPDEIEDNVAGDDF